MRIEKNQEIEKLSHEINALKKMQEVNAADGSKQREDLNSRLEEAINKMSAKNQAELDQLKEEESLQEIKDKVSYINDSLDAL